MHWYEMTLGGAGKTSAGLCQVCRPERVADIAKYMEQVGKNGIVARGSGSSYADQAQNCDGAVMMFDRLDCIRSFNEKTGELICEPGVTLKTVTELYGPAGFMVPTATASGQHTLGGAIASNVIGQSGHKKGSLAKAVNWMDVVLGTGETVRTSPTEKPDLFKAVIGGQGLVGMISLISIKLEKRPFENVAVTRRRLANLDTLTDALKDARKTADFCIAWLDTSAPLSAIGRSVLTTASFTEDPVSVSFLSLPHIKWPVPTFVLRLISLPFFKRLRYKLAARESVKVKKYEHFLYPMDNLKIMSSKGVYQLQASFSEAEGPQAVREILTELSTAKISAMRSYLTLTKEDTLADLAFTQRGYTLCLDFVRRKGLEEFLTHLVTVVLDRKGRISLQDDALIESRILPRMYKSLDQFEAARATYDPHKKFDSDFGRRLFRREKKNEQ